MRTRKPKTPDAILTADIHLRETRPICRTDDWWRTQWGKLKWLNGLQKIHNCPVIDAGDLFHKWKPSPFLLNKTMEYLPKEFFTIPGNHDLPQHNIELLEKSGLGVLERANAVTLLSHCNISPGLKDYVVHGCPWDHKPSEEADILVWHVMTYKGKKPWPGCKDMSAKGILKTCPQYKLILTGHNHKSFIEELDGRILVNPGSLMRQSADQDEMKPRVFFYYFESNTVESVYVPIEFDVVDRGHIDKEKAVESRMDAFLLGLSSKELLDISFDRNMKEFLENNDLKVGVKNKVLQSMGW